jgi:ketosteroid isomerase-like protein
MKNLFVAVLSLFAVALTAFGQCSDADKKKLEEFDRAWGEAFNVGDRAAMSNYLADDFVTISPSGTQSKSQVIDDAVKAAEKNKNNPDAPKVTHDFYVISCTGNTATITHRNVISEKMKGKEDISYSRSVHFLEKRGGNWKVVSSTGSAVDDYGMLVYKEQEWNNADLSRDASWFEKNYADDATDISSRNGLISGKKETIEDLKSSKRVMELAELSNLKVRVDGNFAVVTGVNHVKGRDEKGAAFDRTASFTDTYIKRDGHWLVWATQGTEVKK